MADQILINNTIYRVRENDLPCLITYVEKTGGSHFSVSMIVDLFLQDQKILFLSAYPMAKDNFLEQIKGQEKNVIFVNKEKKLNATNQVIILESGNEKLFLQALKKLSDIDERIILIKNIEVFSQNVFDACLNNKKIILSGDIDKCVAKKQIASKKFNTIVVFTKPKINLGITVPNLRKYIGYWYSQKIIGQAKIKFNQ
jgi:hypothetical protein